MLTNTELLLSIIANELILSNRIRLHGNRIDRVKMAMVVDRDLHSINKILEGGLENDKKNS